MSVQAPRKVISGLNTALGCAPVNARPKVLPPEGHDSEYGVTGYVFTIGTCTRNILPACPGASLTIKSTRLPSSADDLYVMLQPIEVIIVS